MENFKLKLKTALKEQHKKKGEMCIAIGIPIDTYNDRVNKGNFDLEMIKKTCKFLGKELSYFDEEISSISNLSAKYEQTDRVLERMLGQAQEEVNSWKRKYYQVEDLLRQNGLSINFSLVSKRIASCGLRFFFMPNYPQIY
jgi:hypothetical protein